MPRCLLCGRELPEGAMRCPNDGLLVGEAQDPLIGATLAGRYRIVARLARGGMSSVYLSRHVLIDRLCAIKILRRDLCDDPVHRDRFLREARAVNRINHENIVEIVDFGESEDGRVFLVMEYIPGDSLLQRLVRGAMKPLVALEFAIQIASGLARAHQMGVIHRDLKPDNVLIVRLEDGTERVKLLDFGIAKILDQPALTASDKIFGTPGYIAPEYAAGAPIDARADLYSLGVVLYEMVTGSLPFEAELPADLLLKHMIEPPIPPRTRVPSLPEPIEALILQSLAKDPAQRYRDAHHMLEDLRRVYDLVAAEQGAAPISNVVPSTATMVPSTAQIAFESASKHSFPTAATPGAPDPDVGTSVLGVQAWRQYLDSARNELKSVLAGRNPSEDVVNATIEIDAGLVEMRDETERVQELKDHLLTLEARGREFRASIGRAVDDLGSDLSGRARERDLIVVERERLEQEREQQQQLAQGGDREATRRLDALVWEIAASDEILRAAVAACEDLEFQLLSLEKRLDRLNEELEADQHQLVSQINAGFAALAEHDRALRHAAGVLERARKSAAKHG